MNIIVNGAVSDFVDDKLTLSYFNVSFSGGNFPNSFNGQLQVKPENGLNLESTQDEVKEAAKILIKDLLAAE